MVSRVILVQVVVSGHYAGGGLYGQNVGGCLYGHNAGGCLWGHYAGAVVSMVIMQVVVSSLGSSCKWSVLS